MKYLDLEEIEPGHRIKGMGTVDSISDLDQAHRREREVVIDGKKGVLRAGNYPVENANESHWYTR